MAWRPPIMKHRPTSRRRRRSTRSVLRLLDLEHSKTAVLNSLTSQDAQRGYRHAIDEFVDWYCSEPRLAFNRIVVLRYRSHLESRRLAPGTVNLRLGAVRRLAYEAADCGLLSADLAAGIRRVKGVKKLGVRLGNWLTAEQGQALWQAPDRDRLKGKPQIPRRFYPLQFLSSRLSTARSICSCFLVKVTIRPSLKPLLGSRRYTRYNPSNSLSAS